MSCILLKRRIIAIALKVKNADVPFSCKRFTKLKMRRVKPQST